MGAWAYGSNHVLNTLMDSGFKWVLSPLKHQQCCSWRGFSGCGLLMANLDICLPQLKTNLSFQKTAWTPVRIYVLNRGWFSGLQGPFPWFSLSVLSHLSVRKTKWQTVNHETRRVWEAISWADVLKQLRHGNASEPQLFDCVMAETRSHVVTAFSILTLCLLSSLHLN